MKKILLILLLGFALTSCKKETKTKMLEIEVVSTNSPIEVSAAYSRDNHAIDVTLQEHSMFNERSYKKTFPVQAGDKLRISAQCIASNPTLTVYLRCDNSLIDYKTTQGVNATISLQTTVPQ